MKNASKKNYEKTIRSTSAADRTEARKIVGKLLKQAQIGLDESEGEMHKGCV